MKLFALYLPFDYVEVVCDDGTGPTEGGCVSGLICAEDEAKAKAEFVRRVRSSKHAELLPGDENPFAHIVCESFYEPHHFDVSNVVGIAPIVAETTEAPR